MMRGATVNEMKTKLLIAGKVLVRSLLLLAACFLLMRFAEHFLSNWISSNKAKTVSFLFFVFTFAIIVGYAMQSYGRALKSLGLSK